MCYVFNGYELLLFKRFSKNPDEWKDYRDIIIEKEEQGKDNFEDIPQELWYLSVALHQRPRFLLKLVKDEIDREKTQSVRRVGETLLTRYINMNCFTEFHLDSIFKYGDDNKLPKEIFKCVNVRYLSLKYNCLYDIPPDIGHLQKLEYLALTNNRLHVQSIPHTLTFCTSLRTLLLDNNLLDALPGFLLQMSNIETVHRHGNHNYFKSTFMWYHTDVYCRIMPINGSSEKLCNKKLMSLSFWAAKALIGSKKNYFADENVAPVLKDFLCEVYEEFNVCQNCPNAFLIHKPGFKVITFKNPYLGNTCVPFQHWVCSIECARSLEVPARMEQISKARKLDVKYEHYVKKCQQEFFKCKTKRKLLQCLSTDVEDKDNDIESDIVSHCSTVNTEYSSDSASESASSESVAKSVKSKNCVIM